jgi:hypothetical protein
MTKLILAAFAAASLSAIAVSAANAGGRIVGWGCHTCEFKNGTPLTGVALGSASTGTVISVILPSGEVLKLR